MQHVTFFLVSFYCSLCVYISIGYALLFSRVYSIFPCHIWLTHALSLDFFRLPRDRLLLGECLLCYELRTSANHHQLMTRLVELFYSSTIPLFPILHRRFCVGLWLG